MEGQEAFEPTPITGRGVPPEAETRHRLARPPRVDENTISRPSGVQASGPTIHVLSCVKRFGSPPEAVTTYTSDTTPGVIPRTKAMVEPSGENAGVESCSLSEGEVRRRVVESASDSNAIQVW